MKIGITGGIGSGKSYVCKRLSRYGIEVYDCDAAAKRLIRTSPVIRRKLTELIGPDTYIDGQLNKAAVAQFLLPLSTLPCLRTSKRVACNGWRVPSCMNQASTGWLTK